MAFDHHREGLKHPEITLFDEAYAIGGQMVQNKHAFVFWRFYLYEAKKQVVRNVKVHSVNAAKLTAALTGTKNCHPATTPYSTSSKSNY